NHPKAMVFGSAAGIAVDDDVVADLERVAGDALLAKLSAGSPLDRPTRDGAARFLHFHLHEGVRIAIQELHQIAFDFYGLVLKRGGGKGVVSVSHARRKSGRQP